MVSPGANDARRARFCLLPAVCCLLALAGCNNGRQLQADLYQRELRLQEDEIYRLEDCLEEYQSLLCDYRRRLASAQQRLAERAPTAATTRAEDVQAPKPIEPLPPPESSTRAPEIETAPMLRGPSEAPPAGDLDAAPPFDPSDEAPAFDPDVMIETSSLREPAPLRFTDPTEVRPSLASPVTYTAEPIEGSSSAFRVNVRESGPNALEVVVTETDVASLAGFGGEAAVMLTDPSAEGIRRRVALWRFSPEEVEQSWTADRSGRSRLELPIALGGGEPIGRPLRLWVRLTDHDGRKSLEATPLRLVGEPPRLASVAPAEPGDIADAAAWRPASDSRWDPAIQQAGYASPR